MSCALTAHDRHRRVAWAWVMATALLCALGLITAVLMRLELWTPGQDLYGAHTYNQIFTMHGWTLAWAIFFGPPLAVVGHLHLADQGIDHPLARRCAWAGLAAFVASILLVAWSAPGGDAELGRKGILVGLAGEFLAALSVLLAAFTRESRQAFRPRQSLLGTSLALAAVLTVYHFSAGLMLRGAAQVDLPSGEWLTPMLATPKLLSLGLLCWMIGADDPDASPAARRRIALGMLGYLFTGMLTVLWWVLTGDTPPGPLAAVDALFSRAVDLLILFGLIGALLGRRTAWPARLHAVSAVLMYGFMSAVGVYLASLTVDVHLHDTYFVVGHFHAYLGLVAIMLLLYLRWHRRDLRGELAAASVVGESALYLLCWPALAGFTGTMLVLGHQGMPRRYYAYLPEYESLHVWASVFGIVFATGLAIVGLLALRAVWPTRAR